MPAVTIRNLSDEAHRALKVRAIHHGRSAEAEMRDILEAARDAWLDNLIASEAEERALVETLVTSRLADPPSDTRSK